MKMKTDTEEKVLHRDKIVVKVMAIICAAIIILIGIVEFLPIRGENRIYEEVIRIHILANSDDKVDQEIKLALRDKMIEDVANLTAECSNIDEAKYAVNQNIYAIESKAEQYVKGILLERGIDETYSVKASLSEEAYPTRTYSGESGDFSFPAGKYTSLKLIIGKGEGKNWWCVLFPPLCLSGSKIEDDLAVAGYTSEQIGILKKDKSSKYQIRFKILELLWKNKK